MTSRERWVVEVAHGVGATGGYIRQIYTNTLRIS